MKFILLLTNNEPLAAGSMLTGGGGGAQHLVEAIAEFGGTVDREDILPVAGRCDAVVSCELPTHAALVAFALAARASGVSVEAMPAIEADQLDEARAVAKRVAQAQAKSASGGEQNA